MITRYGSDVFFTVSALCVVVAVLSILFVELRVVRYALVVLSAAAFLLTLNFFRDPERRIPPAQGVVLAPADGKIIVVRPVNESEYLHGPATQISIFMSPLDVHVNRNPISGTVRYRRYVAGEYFAAFEDKASERNEQMVLGLEGSETKVLVKQIAGMIARRIVCDPGVGDRVEAGERYGMIKFGSRVDIFVPSQVVVCVKVGDRSVAGETVLARSGQG